MWLAQHAMADPDNAGAGAYAYMDLTGLVSLGWMWLKMARASERALGGGEDRAFHEAKLATARFYMLRALPQANAHFMALASGKDSLMRLPAESF